MRTPAEVVSYLDEPIASIPAHGSWAEAYRARVAAKFPGLTWQDAWHLCVRTSDRVDPTLQSRSDEDLAQLTQYWDHVVRLGDAQLLESLAIHLVTLETLEAAFRDRPAPARVLDYGCGCGDFSAALADFFSQSEVIGLDCSSWAVRSAMTTFARNNLSFRRVPVGRVLETPSVLPGMPELPTLAVFTCMISQLYSVTKIVEPDSVLPEFDQCTAHARLVTQCLRMPGDAVLIGEHYSPDYDPEDHVFMVANDAAALRGGRSVHPVCRVHSYLSPRHFIHEDSPLVDLGFAACLFGDKPAVA